MAVSLRLIVESGDREPAEFLLAGRDAVLGRDPAADVVIDDAAVSTRHGVLRAGAGGYTYTDLASRNGTVLVRPPDPARPLAAGEETPVGPDDVLLLGAADRPVRVRLATGAAPFTAGPPESTVVASFPVSDVLATSPDALVALAAAVLCPGSPADLAAAAHRWLRAALPRAEAWAVRVAGTGFTAAAGDDLPEGLLQEALRRREAVLLHPGGEAAPGTQSVAARGIRAVALCPLLASGTWHGALVAWSSLGSAALPAAALQPLSLAASLVGMAASALAVRREVEEARRALEAEVRRLQGAGGGAGATDDPVGTSPAFLKAASLCRSVAASAVPVLLVGETGTGKEVLARALHRWSLRSGRPFVALNCAALPETLLESELFGHVRGAFTGAGTDRRGLFEEADGGTIFLDEIGEMPLSLQAKLLRVLQDGEVRRVGSSRAVRVDVRVVSATNRDPGRDGTAGVFRSDVFYRLNAVTVRIPPLRERREDIPLLAHHLLGVACRQSGKRLPGFTAEALEALSAGDFPGNVRELGNEMQRAVALTPDGRPVGLEVLSEPLAERARTADEAPAPEGARSLRERVESAERRFIEESLARAAGNVSQAARDLGLTRTGLYKVMDRLRMRNGAA